MLFKQRIHKCKSNMFHSVLQVLKAKIKVVYEIEKITAIIIITGKWNKVDYINKGEKSNLLSCIMVYCIMYRAWFTFFWCCCYCCCFFELLYGHCHIICNYLYKIILQANKFLKCDWLRPEVFKPNLKYLHVKITPIT